ncbi:Gfo/Idh/MocA family oxidoreductase [Streptomyces sp. S1A1-7]|uniref:Gfo/Idh/MocA family oxidoreductase n=1 Tax=Streptomyces sp. S1A1-7 TaxID=2594459 RepID=UPI001F08019F|nr:Gfo/Idh/MocA family oxidoreductase [Streptomyces sp. S1A1-7]
MLHREHADLVVVCTVDRTHDGYIVHALEAGCDVVTEKPMPHRRRPRPPRPGRLATLRPRGPDGLQLPLPGFIDRDHNAAKNVKTAAGLAVAACGAQVGPGLVPAQRDETGSHEFSPEPRAV